MKYLVDVTATIEVEAENVMQAVRVCRKNVQLIGDRIGWVQVKNCRDGTRYSIRQRSFHMGLPCAGTGAKGKP